MIHPRLHTTEAPVSLPDTGHSSAAGSTRFSDIPYIPLGRFPTPVQLVSPDTTGSFWLKDDSLCSPVYGGNKVRKLEYILADATAMHKNRLVTYGDYNSHAVLASALFGIRKGFDVTASIFPPPSRVPCEINWQALSREGLHVIESRTMPVGILQAYLLACKGWYRIPLGASTPVSVLGYVNAVFELARQFEHQHTPVPETLFVTFGTGSTVAGLLLGLVLADVPSRIIAVRTVESIIAHKHKISRLISGAAARLALPPAIVSMAMNRLLLIDGRWIGKGYSYSTPEASAAITLLRTQHICLDPVYTGKTMAAMLDFLREHPRESVLFWNTFCTCPAPYASFLAQESRL